MGQLFGMLAIISRPLILLALTGTGVRQFANDWHKLTHFGRPGALGEFLWPRIQICFYCVFF